jgi:glycoprotein endo-alpha-1,2-mannosidase
MFETKPIIILMSVPNAFVARFASVRASILEVLLVILISIICSLLVAFFPRRSPTGSSVPQSLQTSDSGNPYAQPSLISEPIPPKEVWIIYLGSWGNPAVDGDWFGWNRTTERPDHPYFDPPEDIPSLYYPLHGAYSSHNKTILKIHLTMIRDMGIDAIVVPWLGPWASNGTTSFTDQTIKLLFDLVPSYDLKVIPLFAKHQGRNLTSFLADLSFYAQRYAKMAGHYRRYRRAVAIVQNAHELRGSLELFEAFPDMSFMATSYGLNEFAGTFEDGHTGFVTFFASDGGSWGSNGENWPQLKEKAAAKGVDFIPTVAPGFNETAVVKWAGHSGRWRNCSVYYDARWQLALDNDPPVVLVHSFNDWQAGSVVEPAVERVNYSLSDDVWCGNDGDYYVKETREWVGRFKGKQ